MHYLLSLQVEWKGSLIIALCSKTYIAVDDHQRLKISAKGINHASLRASDPLQKFWNVLETKQPEAGVNKGFRAIRGQVYTYAQKKQCLPYFYCKRYVHDDGIFTSTLQLTLLAVPKNYVSLQTDVIKLSPDFVKRFKVDGRDFRTIRQAVIYQKQLTHDQNDAETLSKITNCTDKYKLEKFNKDIAMSYAWKKVYDTRVEKIITQRMVQNPELSIILWNTGDLKILNTDATDRLGGTGFSAESTRWYNDAQTCGRNLIGELYTKLRQQMKDAGNVQCFFFLYFFWQTANGREASIVRQVMQANNITKATTGQHNANELTSPTYK